MEYLDPLESLVNFLVRAMVIIGPILYIGGSIWVFFDAQKMRDRSEKKKGLHPGIWLVLCLFLFYIAFPIYWIQRRPKNIWKSIVIIVLLWIIPVSIIGLQRFFSTQREALQSILNEQLSSAIEPGMTKNEIEYIMNEIGADLSGVYTMALHKEGSPTPIKAEVVTYIIANDIGMVFFDATVDTLITFRLMSDEDMKRLLDEMKEYSN